MTTPLNIGSSGTFSLRANALHCITIRTLILSAVWLATWYAVWRTQSDYNIALLAALCGFVPLGLRSLYDYRYGLLITIIATPLLVAPIIPKSFLQGFGDLFGICTLIGFILRNPSPLYWKQLWRPAYTWLVFILIAAVLSLVNAPLLEGLKYGIKYGIAEITGYCLVFGYFVILVHEMRTSSDIKMAIYALLAAFIIVAVYSLIGTYMVATCHGGYYGGLTDFTLNQSVFSTFGDPNTHAAYLLTLLPLGLWLYVNAPKKTRGGIIISILLAVLFIQLSTSRAAFLTLILLTVGWVCITKFKRNTWLLLITMLTMLSLTSVIWWYPTCTCPDTPQEMCPFQRTLPQKESIPQATLDTPTYKERVITLQNNKEATSNTYLSNLNLTDSLLRTTKSNHGWMDPVRLQLAKNAISLWQQHPVTGIGAALMSNYSVAFGNVNRAHNMMLTIAAEQGIIGLISWMGWIGCLITILWRARPKPHRYNSAFNYLGLSLLIVIFLSLFMDFYRMIWIWQLCAFIIAWSNLQHVSKEKR